MLLFAMLMSLALGADTEAESTHDLWSSMLHVELQEDLIRPLEAPLTYRQGPARIELRDGWLSPVFSGRFAGEWLHEGDRLLREQRRQGLEPRLPSEEERGSKQLVGFVWTRGHGEVSVDLSDRADGLLLANRLVRELHYDAADLAAVAHDRAPFVSAITEGVLLSVDPKLVEAFRGPNDLDPYEIVVWADSQEAAAARRRARRLFERRTAVWDELDLDALERIAWDRVLTLRSLGPSTGTFGIADLNSAHRYGFVADRADPHIDDDEWLAVLRDTTGRIDPRRSHRVASLGIRADGRPVNGLIGGTPHPPIDPGDVLSAPAPAVRVHPVFADSTVYVDLTKDKLNLRVDATSLLTVRAVGGPTQWFDLAIPRMEAVPDSWRIVAAALEDGTPLLGRVPIEDRDPQPRPEPTPDPEPVDPPDPDERVVRLLLPEPLQEGEETVVRLRFVDTWPYANVGESYTGMMSLGKSSGLQGFLPYVVPGFSGTPWPFRARIAVPDARKLTVSLSGQTTREWVDGDGWRWIAAGCEDRAALWPEVAVGRFKNVDEPSRQGFPAVRTHLLSTHYGAIEQFAPEARRVIHYYQQWLPPFPVDEIDVFEAPKRHGGFVWIAPHGMVNVQQMLVPGSIRTGGGNVRNDNPHLENAVFAHELAHQYWGHLARPANREDFWIAETFSELYSCMYVGAAFGAKACDTRMKASRKRWEQPDSGPTSQASLSRAYSSTEQPDIVYRYGPYVFGKMLWPRLGRGAFFGALDVLLTEHPHEMITTERLRHYLEQASGTDLEDFFDFWVHGGLVPALSLDWGQVGEVVTGEITSDVPFGTFDVPVVIEADGQAQMVWVRVVDGSGRLRFELPSGTRKVRARLDPNHLVLAKSRKVRS